MTTNWQRPRDEHGRFAKPAEVNGSASITYTCIRCGGPYRQCQCTIPATNTTGYPDALIGMHHFDLGPETNTCRTCGSPWRHERHIRPVKVWLTDIDEPPQRTRLLVALPFVIALLGLGFSIAALIVGVQR